MESWVLDGDNYSFFRSAPNTFNLQNLDGPNHVEIFDITNIPSHRGAISETTCLCDIFGDDCESPSLSSSPAATSFQKKDVDERLPVEDVNDSSGSYHTANGSEHLSDGSDTYEDSKDAILSESKVSNKPASGCSSQDTKCYSSQDTSLKLQVENSSDQQLVTSTSEFRDTNIRVTGSTQEIISPHLLSANKTIRDQSHATSSELRERKEIISPDFGCITKRKELSSSEQKENNSITNNSLPENKSITTQRLTTTSEVREAESKQENKHSFNILAAEGPPKENNDLGCCVAEEEKITLPEILPTGHIPVVCETVESDSSVDLTNCLNIGTDFTPFQKTASNSSTKDLREMSASPEHEVVPNQSAHTGTCLHDDIGGLSESEPPNTVPPPTAADDNTEFDFTPQHCTIPSETRETETVHENTTLSLISDTTKEPSFVGSELCSSSDSLGDLNTSEPPIIIHSPVGFTLCPSPEPKNKVWSSGPEDLALRPESPENDFRLTPTDTDSVSSFDSKLCSSPEPRSITPTPEVPGQNVFICNLSPTSSSTKLSSASGSPEIGIVTCSCLSHHSKSPQSEFSSQNESLAPAHDVEQILHAESYMSATHSTKEDEDKAIYSVSSAQEGISCPSTIFPRDTPFPDSNGTSRTKSPTSSTHPRNENLNKAISSNVTLQDTCIIDSHSTVGIPRGTEFSDVHEIESEENSISTIPPANETRNKVVSPEPNLSSHEGHVLSSPSPLCPKDPESSDIVEARATGSPMSTPTTLPINDMGILPKNVANLPILQPLSTERGISRPLSILSSPGDTGSADLDGIRCEKSPALTTALTNESFMAISSQSPTASRDTVFPEVGEIRSMSNIEIENVVITPITQISSTEGGISSSPSRDTMSPDILETSCVKNSMSPLTPTNKLKNMSNSPITNISREEGFLSPSSTLNLPRNTSSPNIDGIKSEEILLSTTVFTNEMMCISNSPNDLLLMESTTRPTSHLSRPRETMCLDVREIPTNVAISPIPNNLSTDECKSRPLSTSSLSRNATSTGVDGLRCVESPILTILPKNEASNVGISPVFDISPMKESISRSSSCLGTPRNSVSPDGVGIRCLENSMSTIPPTDYSISPVCKLLSTEKGTSDSNILKDTTSTNVDEKYTKTSKEIPTNKNNDIASSISNLSKLQTDSLISLCSPEMIYQRSPDRLNDHIPAPEMCIPLGSTNNHLLANVSDKVELPSLIPVDAGQTNDTGHTMSVKSSILHQDNCTNITSVPCCQTNKIGESPEPPAPKLSVKQIKENWERMNETILSSLNPWETSKKVLSTPTGKEAKEVNYSGKEMWERESAGSVKTFGQMAMRPGESPSVLHSNCPSVVEGQSCQNKWGSGEWVLQEEHTLEKGVENIAEGSYRGKQVELSFSTKNRKGPASRSPAPSSRDPKSGIPPLYFESPLATRRQQSLLRAQNIQKEDKTSARRVRSTSQSRYSGVGCLSSECTSETSSMGSEFDDADSEVKWFTDQASSSLSSPQMDYLDVYNSCHGSSTNVSQHSAVDSPGSATWITYADLHETLHEKDDILCDPSSFLPHRTLDPAKPFEMTSFECVDVAMENKEETRRGKRTVPKRQIQFKRRNFDETRSTLNEEKERQEIESPSTQICPRDSFVRQHSTPASMEDDFFQGEHDTQTGKKMLQKSASLDESSPKSKMASNVIKSVLTKKMDTASKQFIRSEPCETKKKHIETISTWESSEAERLSSSLPPECILSSDDFAGKVERSPNPKKKSCAPKVPPKPVFKPNCFPSNSNSAAVAFQGKPLVRDKTKPIIINAFESKISRKQITDNSKKEASKLVEKTKSDSGRSIKQTPHCTAISIASTQKGMTNSDSKHPMIPETHKQQEGSSSMFLSKTPEITLKPSSIKDKNKSSLKDSLCAELKISKDIMCEPRLELAETYEEQISLEPGVGTDTEEDNEKSKEKSVLHKVRDVRKLVKNTYNLSFKASNTTYHVEDVVPEKQTEIQPVNPHHLHIECKAISWKDKQASCNKSTNQQDVTNTADKLNKPQADTGIERDAGVTNAPAETFSPNVRYSDVDLFVGLDKCDSTSKPGNCEQSTKLEMPSRPPSKEISTLVFLQDDTAKSMQNPTSSTSSSVKTANSIHSVSMLRKEKGMQADIGVCDVLSEGHGAKPKHINRLEIPLQTHASEEASSEYQKVKKEDADLPPQQKTSLNNTEGTLQVGSYLTPKEVKVHSSEKAGDNQSQRVLFKPLKEQEIANAASSKAEVRAFSSSTKIQAMPLTTSKEIELPIQVRSITSDRPKPSVLPKPSYKQPFAEIRSTSKDIAKTDITPTTSILKEQNHLKSEFKIIGTSATVTSGEQATNAAASSTKTLAVSAVSSHKPQTIPVTTMESSAHKSSTTTGRQEVSITSVQSSSHRQQRNIREHVMPPASYESNYQSLPGVSQANTYIQSTATTSSTNQLHTDDFHLPTSDDPPSYDERESFSPLQLTDLPPRRQNRYHPTTKHSLCSCTSCTQPQFGQPFHGSQNQTPPAPRSPCQVISYPGAPPQAQVRPHQSRPDGQPSNYPPVSLKSTLQQAPAMIQPMHHSHSCPAPAIQPYDNEQQQPSTQHMDRCSANQRSPQAPSGATYREHSRSPNIAAMDPRSQFFNPQELAPAFGHEYGSDGPGGGGVLYPENAGGLGYCQGPRRVLLDTETGKYFYVEMPMQPLRKMLFDPEIGQYVEVLIPQQGMSNSNLYPPTAVPYQSPYHGQGLYASQYLPYAVPPHPQSTQQPRHPEPSVATSLHQNTMGYGSSASQVPKSDVKGHPSLDQSYLEGMYYIPNRMNASPNSTPSDCYHKPPTNMSAAGGRRA